MAQPRCAIGLLTWNGERDVVRCVESILTQTEQEIEVCWVDNASSDETVRKVREKFTQFTAPEILKRNVGFCAGHNRAFAKTTAPYYLALNQDATLAPDYVQKLCDWMDSDPTLALVSGLILWNEDDPQLKGRIYSAGMAMGYGRFPFELRRNEPHDLSKSVENPRRIVPAVTGAAMLIRRSAIETLSANPCEPFPPEFFAYFEEVDLALRAARAGMRCGVEESAIAWHAERGDGGAARPETRFHYFINHWLMSLRNDSWREIISEFPYILKGEFQRYFPKYFRDPLCAIRAKLSLFAMLPWARRCYRESAARFPDGARGRREFYRLSRELLRRR